MPLYFLIAILGILLFSNCTPHYTSAHFEERTANHQRIAVLPFEMIFTGNMPKEFTEADILQIEEAESKAFQISFYNEILRSTKSGKRPIRVDVQHYNNTLLMLEEKEVDIRTSWGKTPEELADLLGVDAVVRARIEKTRFMSDLESYGIELGTEIVNLLTNYRLFPWLPISSVSKNVKTEYSLLDKKDGMTLWSVDFSINADWRSPANQIIDDISRRAAKKFPYRF